MPARRSSAVTRPPSRQGRGLGGVHRSLHLRRAEGEVRAEGVRVDVRADPLEMAVQQRDPFPCAQHRRLDGQRWRRRPARVPGRGPEEQDRRRPPAEPLHRLQVLLGQVLHRPGHQARRRAAAPRERRPAPAPGGRDRGPAGSGPRRRRRARSRRAPRPLSRRRSRPPAPGRAPRRRPPPSAWARRLASVLGYPSTSTRTSCVDGSADGSPSRCAITRSGTRRLRVRNGRSGSSTSTSPRSTRGPDGDNARRAARRRRRRPRQLQGQPDARPTTGHVVVEVAVEPLEAAVQVGHQGRDQEPQLEGRERRIAGQGHQRSRIVDDRQVGAEVGVRLEAGQQPLDRLVVDVQPTERVVRSRVVGPSVLDREAHASLDVLQPSQQLLVRTRRHRDLLRALRGRAGAAFSLAWRRCSALRDISRGRPVVVHTAHGHRRRLDDVRRGGVDPPGGGRGADHHVQRGLELTTQRGPDVRERAVLRRRQRDRQRHREAELGQRSRQRVRGQLLVPEEAREQRGEEAVLVLRPLRPRGHEVRQLEVAGREMTGGDPARRRTR